MTKRKVHLESEQTAQPAMEANPDGGATQSPNDKTADSQALATLQQELADARHKADEYLDGWQRARAEFTNYKRRVERDQAQAHQNAAGSILKRYLAVVDDLDRALKNRPKDGEGAAWAAGVELIYRKMLTILESEGVTQMQVQGEMFDPNLHEAVMMEDSDQHASGQVTDVLQQGYMLGEKVLRPAMVRVAR